MMPSTGHVGLPLLVLFWRVEKCIGIYLDVYVRWFKPLVFTTFVSVLIFAYGYS